MADLAQDNVARCARILAYARQTGEPVDGLPAEAAPRGEEEAVAIQRQVLEILGDRVAGWKCATPSGRSPSAACLGQAGFIQSPGRLKFRADRAMGVEAEIAFRLRTDLPGCAGGQPYTRDDIVEAIGGALPAIELVQSRYIDRQRVSEPVGAADSISNFGLVHGEEITGWHGLDLSRLRVVLTFGDEVQVDGVGGNPSGDPLLPVVWLANRLPKLGLYLRAGEIVTTGSCTGLLFVKPGAAIAATFEGLGTASLDLVAACPFGFE